MKYDVIIVGGGPSGSMAGINLMGSGLRVAILDRARFPRLKPCGGGISYRAYKRFHSIDSVMRSVPTNFVNRMVFESPSGDVVNIESPHPLYAMIRRIEFDNALLGHCKQGGIEVREDVTVSQVSVGSESALLTSTSGETFEAELVIGADGVNSTVAVHSGLRSSWQPAQVAIDGTEESPLADLSVRQDTMYVYYGIGGVYGYGYVFPKSTYVNFGIGYLLEYLKNKSPGKLYEGHLQFLHHLKQAGVISGDSLKQNFHVYVLPVAGPLKSISRDRILLAGDAAGFVNGFTGEGIYYAMVSGEHAGKVALEAIGKRDTSAEFLRCYDSACDAELGHELRKSVSIRKRLFSNPKTIDGVVRFAARSPLMRRLITEFGVGEISYEEVKKRVIFHALPGYLLYKAENIWSRLAGGS
jgi:geranylgeranyl reductase family protein